MNAPLDSHTLKMAARVLRSLSHPQRLRIVEKIELAGRLTVGRLVKETGIPQAIVSQHLAVLRTAHILEREARGNERHYFIAHPNVVNILNCIRRHGGKK